MKNTERSCHVSIRAALRSAVLLAVVSCTGLVATTHAQTRTPEEQAANRRYRQLDAAYGRPTSGVNAPPSAQAAAPPARPSCRKHFRIDGTDQILSLVKHFYDFSSDELNGFASGGRYTAGWREAWARKYGSRGYEELPGTHTKKQDCAGYVMDQLWRTGQTFVTAGYFYNEIVAKHGTKISGLVGWGAVAPNDIVVWGEAGHVAIVEKVDSDSIIIRTKDGTEPVYRTDLKRSSGNDPLRQAYGTPHIYRVDPRRVRITPVSDQDCDQDPSVPQDNTARVVAALTNLPKCPRRDLGPECFQAGYSVSKDGLAVTTFLARQPPAGSERTNVRAAAWLDLATANRDFKSQFDALRVKEAREHWAFESFAATGQPDTGALAVSLDTRFGGESREAGRANGVLICGRVVGTLDMFITPGLSGKALVDATRAQMKGLLQQVGAALRASGACAT